MKLTLLTVGIIALFNVVSGQVVGESCGTNNKCNSGLVCYGSGSSKLCKIKLGSDCSKAPSQCASQSCGTKTKTCVMPKSVEKHGKCTDKEQCSGSGYVCAECHGNGCSGNRVCANPRSLDQGDVCMAEWECKNGLLCGPKKKTCRKPETVEIGGTCWDRTDCEDYDVLTDCSEGKCTKRT